MKWLAILVVMLAGCAAPGNLGACGDAEPADAGHLTYDLDHSLAGDYNIGNGTVSFLQVADADRNLTPTTVAESTRFSPEGCVWFTVPDGVYHVTVEIPNNFEGGRGFIEENPIAIARGDFNYTLGFHNG